MAIARFDAIRSLPFSGISAAYAAVGTPLTRNWRIFKISNNTDGDLFISADGVIDNFFIPAGSFTLYDLSTNAPPVSQSDTFVDCNIWNESRTIEVSGTSRVYFRHVAGYRANARFC